MDTLQLLPLDQWPVLKDKFKALWPLNVGGYYALQTNIECPAIRDTFRFCVYCPFGDMDNGFVATTNKGGDSGEVIIYSINEDTNKLEEALANTKIIDWKSKVCIGSATSSVIRLVEKLKTTMEFQTFQVWGALMICRDETSEQFKDVKCPPDTFLAAVNSDHIKQVDDVWPFRHSTSQLYFSTLISNLKSYGLYSHDKKLLAWIFLNEFNSMCHLYCEESHRKKGYAEFLVKTVVNDSLKQGNAVYGYVVPGNKKAMELFTKLGFQHSDDGAWLLVGS